MGILQIGAGGVGWVVAHKIAQNNALLGSLVVATRTQSKAERIFESIHRLGNVQDSTKRIASKPVNAADPDCIATLIEDVAPNLVINVGPPSVNLAVMEACARTGVSYLDTSVAVDLCSPGQQVPQAYDAQWAFRDRFEEKNITAILGIGFDPGAVSVFAAHSAKHLFDRIDSIDVLDVNAGSHGRSFATNFDPETNLREVLGDSFYWDHGRWQTAACHSRSFEIDLPVVGRQRVYSMAHDEVRSLVEHIAADHVEFWMGFSDDYLRYFNVLRDVGLLSTEPVTTSEGMTVSPLAVLKAVLPDPIGLAPDYSGKTCIGTLVKGENAGQPRQTLLYNVCDHEDAYSDVEAQAISYTTGVPAATAAILHHTGVWAMAGVFNVEQFDPDPFLALMPSLGLSWEAIEVSNQGPAR